MVCGESLCVLTFSKLSCFFSILATSRKALGRHWGLTVHGIKKSIACISTTSWHLQEILKKGISKDSLPGSHLGWYKGKQTLPTPKCDPEFRVYICRGEGMQGAGTHSHGREKLPAVAGGEASLECHITCSSHLLLIPHLLPKGCHTASRGKHGYERPDQL